MLAPPFRSLGLERKFLNLFSRNRAIRMGVLSLNEDL
jgi:hypothetical protein